MLLFFLIIFQKSTIGQEPGMWHITDEDGLPSMTVYQTAQDSLGFIWMGTEKGICRFDGKAFKYYKSPDFSDSEILTVKIDQYDRVWFRNLAGQFFYIENEVIHNVKELFEDKGYAVQDFIIQENTIYLSLKKGKDFLLAYLSTDGVGETSVTIGSNYYSFLSSLVIYDKVIYVFSQETNQHDFVLRQFAKENNSFNEVRIFKKDIYKGLKTFYKNEDQWFLVCGVDNGFDVLQLKGNEVSPFLKFKENNSINNFIVLENTFWFSTPKGVFVQPINQANLNAENYLLSNVSTNHLMLDVEGNKWISTTGQGIYVINSPQTNIFKTSNFDLPSNKIYSLVFDPVKKQLLVGHDNGLISIIDSDRKIQTISTNTSGRFVDLLVDHNGDYWCANDKGLFKIDANLDVEKKLPNVIKSIYQDSNNFWFNSYNNVFIIPNEKLDIITNVNRHWTIEHIFNAKSYATIEDFLGNIWMGTIKGIEIYRNNKVLPFLENEKQIPYSVAAMHQTLDSIIWVGTRGDGLIGIKNKKVIFRYNESVGLASNNVKCLAFSENYLWAGTDNGINKLDLKTKTWEWINTADGLPSNEINDIEIVDQEVWIGTAKGLVNFDINTDHTNNYSPPIYISGIKIEERDTTIQDSFYLPYNQNSIQIDFTGIGFRGKGQGSFEYRLSGVDDDWVSSEFSFTRYPNLAPGNYDFEVVALNEDQVKSETPAKVFFSISPPWWKTWWFRLLGLVTIFTLTVLIINTRRKRQKRDQFFIDQVNELQANALRSQMNPHFIFNSLNAIQQFLTTNNREQAMIYLSRFGKLIRMIFEQSQKEKITLEEEIEFLNLYLDLEQLRFMDRVEIKLEISEDLEKIADEINIPPLLIQPIIENSFKHGFLFKKELGILKINFSSKGDFLICTIEDNGIGREKAAALGQKELKDRSSSGLITARERLKINNKSTGNGVESSGIKITDLHEEKGDVSGTLVEITVFCKELKLNES